MKKTKERQKNKKYQRSEVKYNTNSQFFNNFNNVDKQMVLKKNEKTYVNAESCSHDGKCLSKKTNKETTQKTTHLFNLKGDYYARRFLRRFVIRSFDRLGEGCINVRGAE